jgi:hypothetical protein
MQALVKRFEGQPFDILGINTDSDKEQYKKDCISEGVTWRSTWEGKENALVNRWGVSSFPTIYILDAEGRIRFKNSRGAGLERDVAILMAELGEGAEEPVLRDEEARSPSYDEASLDALLEAHTAADLTWREAMLELRGKERRELKKVNPAAHFLADFQQAADAGSGRAKLWLAAHLGDASDMKASEVKKVLSPLFGELCNNFATEDIAPQILEALIGSKRWLDARERASLLGAFAANCNNHALEGDALGAELAFYQTGKESGDAELAAQIEARLVADYPDTEAGASIWGKGNKNSFRGVGTAAPDFPAVDTSGEAFRLSDYRGKVVMLDFWGFW